MLVKGAHAEKVLPRTHFTNNYELRIQVLQKHVSSWFLCEKKWSIEVPILHMPGQPRRCGMCKIATSMDD